MQRAVKTGKAPCEHMFSALPLKADVAQRGQHVCLVPIGDSCTPVTASPTRPSHKRARAIWGVNWSALLWKINGLRPQRMRSTNDGTCHLLVMNEKRDVALKAQDLKV